MPTPTGCSFSNTHVAITAPDASSEDPLVIKFVIDSSLASTSLGGPGIFRDGQKVPRCDSVAPAGTASPDPCVSERQPQENGNLEITVLASKAFVASTTAASQPVAAGDTVSTGGGSTPTADNPVITSVTSPNAGQVSIAEDPTITQQPPSSAYTFFGQEIHITAPDATIENPLVLRFKFDSSVVPSSGGTIVLLRNGELVPDCTDPASESATPDPCVYKQETLSDGTIEIGVYTSQASLWAAAVLRRYDFEGFFPPVDNPPDTLKEAKAGSAIPVKFSLSGDEGLDVFAEGYPKSEKVDCGSDATVDGIEQTVTAGGSSLSYDATTDRHTYVWKTDKAWSNDTNGPCRQLVVKLKDGSFHRADFEFTKKPPS